MYKHTYMSTNMYIGRGIKDFLKVGGPKKGELFGKGG